MTTSQVLSTLLGHGGENSPAVKSDGDHGVTAVTKEIRSAFRVLLLAAAMFATPAFAQEMATPPAQDGTPAPAPARVGTIEVHGQATWVGQRQFALRRRDQQPSGPASLRPAGERRATQTLTLFVAARAAPNLDVFLNPEAAMGGGIADGGGLAAQPNGDLIGQQAFGDRAYLARCFVR